MGVKTLADYWFGIVEEEENLLRLGLRAKEGKEIVAEHTRARRALL